MMMMMCKVEVQSEAKRYSAKKKERGWTSEMQSMEQCDDLIGEEMRSFWLFGMYAIQIVDRKER
jgi:hypothetical protein